MSRRETCHCGHDRSSHYQEQGVGRPAACLCAGCTCLRYRHEDEPQPSRALNHSYLFIDIPDDTPPSEPWWSSD